MKRNLFVLITSDEVTLQEKCVAERSATDKNYDYIEIKNDDCLVVQELSSKSESGEYIKIEIHNSHLLKPSTIRELQNHFEGYKVGYSFYKKHR